MAEEMPQSVQFSSVQFSRSVMSDSLRPHESQEARPPCPSPTPGIHCQETHLFPWTQGSSWNSSSVQFSSVAQSCPTLCDPMDCSTPGLPAHNQLPELAQIHVHWVSDAIQPSYPLLSLSPPAFNLYQHQGLFHWVSSLHQVAKVLEFQVQHQSFQWIFRADFF